MVLLEVTRECFAAQIRNFPCAFVGENVVPGCDVVRL